MLKIALIISTRNRATYLDSCLRSLKQLIVPNNVEWQIIIVDNNSEDETKEILNQYKNDLPLKTLFYPEANVSLARNFAINYSTSDYIIFSDDDVTFEIGWLEYYYKAFHQFGEAYFYGGPVEVIHQTAVKRNSLLKHPLTPHSIKGLAISDSYLKDPYFIGPNWAAPRKALIAVGLFDAAKGSCLNSKDGIGLSGEETDLMNKLKQSGLKAKVVANAVVYHHLASHKLDFKFISNRIISYTRSNITYNNRNYLHILILLIKYAIYKLAQLLLNDKDYYCLWLIETKEKIRISLGAKS